VPGDFRLVKVNSILSIKLGAFTTAGAEFAEETQRKTISNLTTSPASPVNNLSGSLVALRKSYLSF
jgi:hypothetical protein